jgi:hypothetical protein
VVKRKTEDIGAKIPVGFGEGKVLVFPIFHPVIKLVLKV